MDLLEDAYGDPLSEREELIGLLTGYRTMVARLARGNDPAVSRALAQAEQTLAATPCDVAAARLAVTTFRELVRTPAPVAAAAASASQTQIGPPDPAATGATA